MQAGFKLKVNHEQPPEIIRRMAAVVALLLLVTLGVLMLQPGRLSFYLHTAGAGPASPSLQPSLYASLGSPVQVPIIQVGADSGQLEAVIMAFVDGRSDIQDPLVKLRDGIYVKTSNLNGIQIGPTRYFYSLAPESSFDPVSRGLVTPAQVEIVSQINDSEGFHITIYRVKSDGRGT
ncbi:MAG: hypothetical protein HY326_07705 [Chloroflexi bacterium]|nr:hypothetical protein [Chloroflexota bacterium]